MATQAFQPTVEVRQPSPGQSKPTHKGTVVISDGDQKVAVMMHSDGAYRFRVYNPHMVVTEGYFGSAGGKHTIIGVKPVVEGRMPEPCPFACGVVPKTLNGLRVHLESKHGAA